MDVELQEIYEKGIKLYLIEHFGLDGLAANVHIKHFYSIDRMQSKIKLTFSVYTELFIDDFGIGKQNSGNNISSLTEELVQVLYKYLNLDRLEVQSCKQRYAEAEQLIKHLNAKINTTDYIHNKKLDMALYSVRDVNEVLLKILRKSEAKDVV